MSHKLVGKLGYGQGCGCSVYRGAGFTVRGKSTRRQFRLGLPSADSMGLELHVQEGQGKQLKTSNSIEVNSNPKT